MENKREYNNGIWRNRRKKIIDYLGGKCVSCGSTYDLEIDHIDRGKKSFNISRKCTLENVIDELSKCQLLCGECHRKKTSSENSGFEHGTVYAWMKKKCQCDICESSKKLWNDERNKKRRSGGKRGMYNLPSPHGTIKSYHRGCKCDLCRRANADHAKELKRKRDSTQRNDGAISKIVP